MPYHKISRDIKLAAIRLYEQELLPLNDILDCLGFHERTFYRILALWRETGDVVKHNFGAPGRPRIGNTRGFPRGFVCFIIFSL